MKVTLFMPVLNEVVGLKAIMPRVKPEWVDQILVSDGGSTDGSVEFVLEQGYELHRQSRRGLRFAYSEAWPKITGDVVVTFSPDGNCIPELIPDLIAEMKKGFDLVVASRYFGGIESEDDGFVTKFGNWYFTHFLINGLHGGSFTDALGIFRAYRTSLYYELNIDADENFPQENFLFTVMGVEQLISTRAVKRGLKIGEIPGLEMKRIGGRAKLQIIRWGLAYSLQIIRELWFWK